MWWRAVGASSGYARAWGGAQASGPAAAGKKAAPKSSVKMKEDKKHAHVSEYLYKRCISRLYYIYFEWHSSMNLPLSFIMHQIPAPSQNAENIAYNIKGCPY